MDNRYRKSTSAVYSLKYHLVFCPKYRRPVLVNGVDVVLKELIQRKAEELGITIHALEVMPDYVHIFLEADPTDAPHRIVNQLKGYTSHILREQFPWLKSRLPTLWNRSYFIASVGSVTEEAVRLYIENQKGK
jgi:putative transposase